MPIDESPPPYSAVATPESLESLDATLPFAHSDLLVNEIRALLSEGVTLCSRFKDFHEVASANAKFEYQVSAFILSQKFEALIWESRNIAGVTFVAVKDFNEIILDFLSEPDASIQDKIKELSNTSKELRRERDSAASHKSSFDALVQELEDYSRMTHSEPGALIPQRQRQFLLDGRGTRVTRPSRKSNFPYIVPRAGPRNGISMITASFGAISRTCMDYALNFERIAEQAVFPSCARPLAETPAVIHGSTASLNGDPGEHKCTTSPTSMGHAELPALVDTLLREVRGFASRADVFNTVLVELAREQDTFVLYLKDGQSVANQRYRSEINRLRRHLPRICSALDAYSKVRFL